MKPRNKKAPWFDPFSKGAELRVERGEITAEELEQMKQARRQLDKATHKSNRQAPSIEAAKNEGDEVV